MNGGHVLVWLAFNVAVLALLAVDLTLFHRSPREMRVREALGWTAMWVALALLFNVVVYFLYLDHAFGFGLRAGEPLSGRAAALQFLTGYLIELSLSVDNLFVFLAIFKYFGVHGRHQHRVLFWGIVAAVALRGTMIVAGVTLIQRFHALLYVLGAFVILTGIKLLREGAEEFDVEHNLVLRLSRRFLPVATGQHGEKFMVRQGGRWMATPLALVLIVVNVTDVLFAMDSIPAVLAITHDSFIAYTSNFLAILGLRAMYFALAGVMGLFHYLRYGLAAVLIFVGVKMVVQDWFEIPVGISLGVVGGLIALSVLASVLRTRTTKA
ncbi:MAG TPA: TerC family protein [Candidatus Polarisedimenticolaceae bacterium]|nr:TerC family protein [Candidatus Polarisedimenticolaceae bacterium]